jgi:hypothetical protein
MRQVRNWNGFRSAFDAESAYGWPAWQDMRPLLLRSAGVVGLAGMIVAIISNDALFEGAAQTTDPRPAVWQESSEPEEPVAAIIDPAELRETGAPVVLEREPVISETGSVEVSAGPPITEPESLVFTGEPLVGALERTQFAAKPAATPIQEVAARVETAPHEVLQPEVPQPEASPQKVAIPPASISDLEAAQPEVMPEESESAAASMSDLEARMSATAEEEAELVMAKAEDTRPERTGAIPSAPHAAVATAAKAEAAAIWAKGAVDCPRSWIAEEAQSVPAHCETIVAMLNGDAAPEEQAALESAAEEHAAVLSTLGPRIPRVRPEPSPELVEKVIKLATAPAPQRRRGASDWPASPPPNCGTKHAYWRFVDRGSGAKEWYCK